jgi:hypothetical protein
MNGLAIGGVLALITMIWVLMPMLRGPRSGR